MQFQGTFTSFSQISNKTHIASCNSCAKKKTVALSLQPLSGVIPD